MNGPVTMESEPVGDLRRAFDQSFAAPARAESGDLISFVAIRAGAEALVLRADQITGIARRRRIVPVSGRVPELMGISGMRGALVPVFSLAALLDLARHEECAWLALVQRELPFALAFDEFQGQIEIQRTSLYDNANATRRHVRQLAHIGSSVRAVIDIPSLMETIRRAAEASRS